MRPGREVVGDWDGATKFPSLVEVGRRTYNTPVLDAGFRKGQIYLSWVLYDYVDRVGIPSCSVQGSGLNEFSCSLSDDVCGRSPESCTRKGTDGGTGGSTKIPSQGAGVEEVRRVIRERVLGETLT